MSIEARLESDDNGEIIQSMILDQDTIYHEHDIHLGRLIIAWSLADHKGAVVHLVEDFHEDPQLMTADDLFELSTPENLYAEVPTWFSVSLPTHMDSGKAVNLKVQHRPDGKIINEFRPHTSFD
jgi:hypothetical protein